MFPYRDENPTEKPAIITVAIIIANALVFILIQGAGAQGPLARSVCELGLIPGELLHTAKPGSGVELLPGVACLVGVAPKYWTVITSMFTHGGWLHLIGNMLFLWVFGNNIEDAMGHGKFIVFYLLCGIAAAATQTFLSPHSVVPMVGASGAISGVLGAYLLLAATYFSPWHVLWPLTLAATVPRRREAFWPVRTGLAVVTAMIPRM